MSAKLEEGDFRGAIRLACSNDKLAPFSSGTFTALQAKHPQPRQDTSNPPPLNQSQLHWLLDLFLMVQPVDQTV